MKVKDQNNKQFLKLLKTRRFKELLASQERKAEVPFIQDITGYSRTYIFAWKADPESVSYLPMPDSALRLFKLELGFAEPRYPAEG